MTLHTDWQQPSPAHHMTPTLFLLGTALARGTAVLVFAAAAQAQVAQPAAAPAPAGPKYTVAQIAQAFGFIDGNKDGHLSRE